MKTTVERLDDVTVKLTVEIPPKRVSRAMNEAAKHLAQGVTLPGFRKGKIPRKVLQARLGQDAIVQHAMEDSLGEFYGEALRQEELIAVGNPEIDVKNFDESEGATFEATVQVRPEFEPPDHTGISIVHPDWDVEHVEIEQQIENLRERFAELEEVDRPAQEGDYVTLDLEVRIDGEVLESATVEDALYEIGSGGVTPKLDEELVSVTGGSDFTYVDELPEEYPEHGGEEAEFAVTVKDVREKNLPELDDDFAATASEFETIDELREDVRRTLLRRSVSQAREQLRARVLEAYLARVDIPLPEQMIEAEKDFRRRQVESQAEQFGLDVEQLLLAQGTSQEEWERTVDERAHAAVKAQIVLDELARKLEIQVSGEDLDAEIVRHAVQNNVSPQQIAEVIRQQGSAGALVGDVVRRKSINALVEAAEIDSAPPRELLVDLGILADESEGSDDGDGDEELPTVTAGDADAPKLEVATGAGDIKRAVEEST
ncbi:MAG: trigger factor [Actinobacteria bacterium]|nr:trigger factor [Actinomycetota bacterium]